MSRKKEQGNARLAITVLMITNHDLNAASSQVLSLQIMFIAVATKRNETKGIDDVFLGTASRVCVSVCIETLCQSAISGPRNVSPVG